MKKLAFALSAALVLGSASAAFAKKEVRVPVGAQCPAGFESAGAAYDRVNGKWVQSKLCRAIHPMR